MSIRPLIYLGDPRLTTSSDAIEQFDNPELQTLIDDMFETMYFNQGVGLAAPQLGINQQLMVIDVTQDKSQQWCFINPEVIWSEDTALMMEGCLSIPGVYEEIQRPKKVKTKALDRKGKPFEIEADGLLARCIQHECDHLAGKLFIDYLSSLKRQRALDQFHKAHREKHNKA